MRPLARFVFPDVIREPVTLLRRVVRPPPYLHGLLVVDHLASQLPQLADGGVGMRSADVTCGSLLATGLGERLHLRRPIGTVEHIAAAVPPRCFHDRGRRRCRIKAAGSVPRVGPRRVTHVGHPPPYRRGRAAAGTGRRPSRLPRRAGHHAVPTDVETISRDVQQSCWGIGMPLRYLGPNTSMAIRPALTAQGQPA